MSGRVVRKLTKMVEAARDARQARNGRRRREVHDERLAQKVAAEAEARRNPYRM